MLGDIPSGWIPDTAITENGDIGSKCGFAFGLDNLESIDFSTAITTPSIHLIATVVLENNEKKKE